MTSPRTTLVAFFAWSAVGAVQDSPFEVESAYHADDALRFSPRLQIDWQLRASDSTRALSVPTEDPTVIARFAPLIDMFGGVEVRSRTSTPVELASRQVYFVGVDGVHPLGIDSTVVATRLEFNPRGTRLEGRRSWGEVFGSPSSDGTTSGGFALHATRALSFHVSPSNFTADDLLLGSDAVQQTPDGGYWSRGTAFWEIVAQYRFSIEGSGDEWVFVQWAPDREMIEAGCRYRYALFLASEASAPSQVSWTAYGCDV